MNIIGVINKIDSEIMQRCFLYILLLLVPSTLLKATDYVAIIEILYDTPLNEDPTISPHNFGEFITLYNFGEDTVDMQGWSLKTISPAQSMVLPDTSLPPKRYLMIAYGAENTYNIAEEYGDYPENWTDLHVLYEFDPKNCPIVYQTSMMLPNDTCSVILQDNNGATRDSVRYGPDISYDTMIATNNSVPEYYYINAMILNTVRRHRVVFTLDGTTSFDPLNWQSSLDPDVPDNYISTYSRDDTYPPFVTLNIQSPTIEANNYIVQILPQVAMEGVPTLGMGETISDAHVCVQRFDAFGRHTQTIQKNATPSGKHLLTYQEYDPYNRPTKNWLPVASEFSFLESDAFQSTSQQFYPSETSAYEEQLYSSATYDNNVMTNAPIGIRKAGKDLGGRYAGYTKKTNDANRVKIFKSDATGVLRNVGYYAIGTLVYEQTKDEDGKLTSTYTDREGRVIMTSKGTDADTYHVYNSLGQLAYVLPPSAADALGTGNYNDDTPALKKYAYVYRYDERGNRVYKRLPGCEPTYMVYDAGSRLVKTQDGNQRARGHYWTVYKYDKFNRIVYTSEVLTGGSDLQDAIDSFKDWNVCETFSTTTQSYPMEDTGYSRGFYHNRPTKLLTVNYYDTYDFLSCLSATTSGELAYEQRDGYDAAITVSTKTKGRLTGTRTYNLKDNTYTVTAYYYDLDGYLVQQRSTNRLGGTDNSYWDVDFRGNPLKMLTTHNTSTGIQVNELYTYTYDHAKRLLSTTYQHNDDAPMVLNSFQYDELGRVRCKRIYDAVDSIQYQYNIRNWITRIKSADFEERIAYTQPIFDDPNMPAYYCYNGNISGTTWTYQGKTNGYIYDYDDYNRFYLCYSILDSTFGDYLYTERMSYDKLGNITQLIRWDNSDEMNRLQYTYEGNQLVKVTDQGFEPVDYDCKRYMDMADSPIEFGYDANGNLIYDLDREIVAIRYNILNLPDTVQFANGSQIINHYDALGKRYKTSYRTRKVAATVPIGITLSATDNLSDYTMITHAMDKNIKYLAYGNDALTLDYVFNSEGYIRYYNAWEHYRFYYIKDHLGNVRETYANPEQGSKLCAQRMQYYPSGLPWNDNLYASEQPYKYNGKEFIEMHGLDEYDSEARWYYPALGRTTTMDPLCEKYYNISPYAWCGNNFVNIVDLDGKDPIYAKSFIGNINLIGDDGSNNSKSYLVRGTMIRKVKNATKNNEFYKGDLSESHRVIHIPTGQILEEVKQSYIDTQSSQREQGGHKNKNDITVTRWDAGDKATSFVDIDGLTKERASLHIFVVDGKQDVPRDASNIEMWWHTHPNTGALGSSTPSENDFQVQESMVQKGYKGNTFVIGVKTKTVTFFNENRELITIKWSDFIKMGEQQK